MTDPRPPASPDAAEGWGLARPRTLPRPTASPALAAAGVVLVMWGLVASPILSGFGGALFLTSLVIWIRELTHERRTAGSDDP